MQVAAETAIRDASVPNGRCSPSAVAVDVALVTAQRGPGALTAQPLLVICGPLEREPLRRALDQIDAGTADAGGCRGRVPTSRS